MKNVKLIVFLLAFVFSSFSFLEATEKFYIDEKELCFEKDTFHIHIGENVWIQTNTLHKDETGTFVYDYDLLKILDQETEMLEYQKTWKCPYCYNYWPLRISCQKIDCSSKY